jgi:acyl-CoA thioesterase-1
MFGQVGAVKATERPVNIVVLGDSLSAGFGLTVEDAFPAKLAAALKAKGAAVKITNAGVSGALRGLDPVLTKAALDTILNKLTARHIPVLLAGMQAPPNMGADYARTFDAIYPALASTHPVVFYPFFLDGVAADPKLNQSDGLHPNVAGVDAIVVRILPAVEELIKRARAGRAS